jgi:hypothetical protein
VTSEHLTDEQFADLLSGEWKTDLRIHEESCADCRSELDQVQSAIRGFNEVGLRWAEIQAPRRVPVPSKWSLRLHTIPRWSMAAAAMLIIGTAVGVHEIRQPVVQAPTTVAVTASEPSKAVIADDNQLMQSIDQELSADVRPPVPASELQTAATPHRRVAEGIND